MVPHLWPELAGIRCEEREALIGFHGVFRRRRGDFRRPEVTRMSLPSFLVVAPSKAGRRFTWKRSSSKPNSSSCRNRLDAGKKKKKRERRSLMAMMVRVWFTVRRATFRRKKKKVTGGKGKFFTREGKFSVFGLKKNLSNSSNNTRKNNNRYNNNTLIKFSPQLYM